MGGPRPAGRVAAPCTLLATARLLVMDRFEYEPVRMTVGQGTVRPSPPWELTGLPSF